MEKPLYQERKELQEVAIGRSIDLITTSFKAFRPVLLAAAGNIDKFESKENDNSPVTELDRAVEKAIQDLFAGNLEGDHPPMDPKAEATVKQILKNGGISIPVFGEETGYDDQKLPELCWLVDPIDGTSSFIEGKPTFTNMAVLIKNRKPIASVIYNPSTDEMFVARKNKGAFKNGKQIDLSRLNMPKHAICKDSLIGKLGQIFAPMNISFLDGSSGGGFGFTTILNGETAARFNLQARGYTHDYAPGGLLVQEAGGVLIPIKDKSYNFTTKSFIACHPDLAEFAQANIEKVRELESV